MRKQFTFIHGSSGTGKTLYLRDMIAGRIRSGGRVCTLDPNGIFDGYGDVMDVDAAVKLLSRKGGSEPFAIVVRVGWGESWSPVWPAVFRAGHVLLAADEAQNWFASPGAQVGTLDPEAMKFQQVARNRCCDLATTSQAPTTLHPSVRLNYDVRVTFRQDDPGYAVATARTMKSKELEPLIGSLPDRCYLRVTNRGELSRGGPLPVPPVPPLPMPERRP